MKSGLIGIFLFVLTISLYSQSQFYKYSNPKPTQLELPKELKEISGLALTDDQRLFAHGDEKGTIYQLDINTGEIVKEFEIGDKKVEEDFEGIATVNNKIFMVVSNGDIYEFEEGENDEEVDYKVYKTDLKSKFDVEGLCYDKETNSLLLACKEFAGKKYDESKTVYSFDLKKKKLDEKPRFIISLNKLEKKWDVDKFKPSAIERHPKSGTYFILGGKGLVILEISKEGNVMDEMILDKEYHHQPEGIAFLKSGTMIISDEADKDKATLTFYKKGN